MTAEQLAGAINLKGGFLSIAKMRGGEAEALGVGGCALKALARALAGETVVFSPQNLTCRGAASGIGFQDGIPEIPGGFGHFIAHGRGEGFPPGERIKCSPELSEMMLMLQPQGVMEGHDRVRVKPYAKDYGADTVTALVNMDQMAALIHIFNYRRAAYDTVIAPMVSGCASLFRVPFGEAMKESGRAVIGNVDIFSRPHFDKEKAFFTVSGADFEGMLHDADESVLASPIWRGIKKRLEVEDE